MGENLASGDAPRKSTGGRNANPSGTDGEHSVGEKLRTAGRTTKSDDGVEADELTERMRSFVADRWLAIVGATTADGVPFATPWIGVENTLHENDGRLTVPHPAELPGADVAGVDDTAFGTLLFVDWWNTTIGLHVNGEVEHQSHTGRTILDIETASIHRIEHGPQLAVESAANSNHAFRTGPTGTYDSLTDELQSFVSSRLLTFLATADRHGETDVSPRLGPRGFLQVVDSETIRWAEYRDKGVSASIENIVEQPNTTLLFVDWWDSKSLVWVTGEATVHESIEDAETLIDEDRRKAWVELDVTEVVVTECPSLPTLSIESFDPPWGTDDSDIKTVGYFSE